MVIPIDSAWRTDLCVKWCVINMSHKSQTCRLEVAEAPASKVVVGTGHEKNICGHKADWCSSVAEHSVASWESASSMF